MFSLPNRKTLPALLALMLLVLTVASCKNFFVDPKLTSIAVNPVNVLVNQTASAVATGTYDDGSTQTPPSHVVWSIPLNSAATVDAKGLVMGVDAGSSSKTATITATVGAISGSATVTVSCGTIQSISIVPSSKTLGQNASFNFTANATYAPGSGCISGDVTSLATWTSSNSALFTVESTGNTTPGMVTANNAGTAGMGTLMATLGGQQGMATITITNP